MIGIFDYTEKEFDGVQRLFKLGMLTKDEFINYSIDFLLKNAEVKKKVLDIINNL